MNTTETTNTNESISNDCNNTMSYPPKTAHMIYLAQLGATRAVKHNKTEAVNKSQPNDIGKKVFQPKLINWSYR